MMTDTQHLPSSGSSNASLSARRMEIEEWSPGFPLIRLAVTWIRTLVSGDKRRFRDGTFDLDLTYITDRILAMAIPATGISQLWRNPARELAAMLNKYHPQSYRIFNLSTLPYDYSYFDPGSVVELGFPDHHNPPILLLHRLCLEMDAFLASNQRNVVLIHCLAGRGRTGTVIASYLTFSSEFDSGSEALDWFARTRSYVDRGVQQPSQRRYVQYYSELLAAGGGRRPQLHALRLLRMVIWTDPGDLPNLSPQVDVMTAPTQDVQARLLFRTEIETAVKHWSGCTEIRFGALSSSTFPLSLSSSRNSAAIATDSSMAECILPPVSDIYVRCYHCRGSSEVQPKPFTSTATATATAIATKRKYLFRLGFNTGFVAIDGTQAILRLTKSEIDDAVKKSRFDTDFFVDLIFEPQPCPFVPSSECQCVDPYLHISRKEV